MYRDYNFPLKGQDQIAILRIPVPLSRWNYEHLKRFLELLEVVVEDEPETALGKEKDGDL